MTSTDKIRPHFYRLAQLAMTPFFHNRDYSLFSFVFMQREPPQNWHIGCTFADIINEGTDAEVRQVCMWPETPPDQVEYSHLRTELDNIPPPPVLRAPVLDSLGTNNTWDPTAMVLPPDEHARIAHQRDALLRAATKASIRSMVHMIEHAAVTSHVGTPHLMSGCDCNYSLAKALLAPGTALREQVGGDVDTLIERFRDVMQRTSMKSKLRVRPIVGTFAFNYEQWLDRADAIHKALTTVTPVADESSEVFVLPAGVHIGMEPSTAETGGLMLQKYTMIEYRE